MDPLMAAQGDESQARQRDIRERIKELDHAHRNLLPASGAAAALSFRFLRTLLAHALTPTERNLARPVAHPPPHALDVTFVGHATAMLTSPHARVLTDPLLRNTLYGVRRARAAVLAGTDIDDVSLILVSHAHADHLDRRSLRLLPRAGEIVVPPRCAGLVRDLGFRAVIELTPGEEWRHRDLMITALPARHDGGGVLRRRGCNAYLIASADVSCYFAGDTGYFSGFSDLGRQMRPDVALLPIGGYDPLALRADHLSPLDAVSAFADLRARLLVPIGFGSFPLGYERPEQPLIWLRALAAERRLGEALAVLGHGETLTVRRP